MSVIWDFIGNLTGANDAAQAAQQAAATQSGAADAGIAESRRQFDKIVSMMSPFVNAGTKALASQQALIGQGTPEDQAAAYAALENSPEMAAMMQSGENALLQNAGATGGLRGGNIQQALSKFRPEMLSRMIDNQYSRLGGITRTGQAAAAGQGSAGMATGTNIANLLQQQGAAQAGGALAQGNLRKTQVGDLLKIGGIASGFF